jgi:hypothetical protein
MIPASEHFDDDDPAAGHADVRTRLDGVSYFFLGNGRIEAAVQWAPNGDGTPLGLLLMDPERLGKKRDALTCDESRGLEGTVIRLCDGHGEGRPAPPDLRVEWVSHHGVPAVQATWSWQPITVRETFFCPDRASARLARQVEIDTTSAGDAEIVVATGDGAETIEQAVSVGGGRPARRWFVYGIGGPPPAVRVDVVPADPLEEEAIRDWQGRTRVELHGDPLGRLFACSASQLPAVISTRGRVDASLWQYNREWVRDQAFLALALVMIGRREEAAVILRRLLRDFVSAEGAPMDSSEVRGRDEVELDQNGVLLYVLEQYVLWTDDLALAGRAWDRVCAVAEYPLRREFSNPAGLLHNVREFWERHRLHGIEPGFELVHQVFVSMGLASAARLARRFGRDATASRWDAAARDLRAALLDGTPHALVQDGRLVKRRLLDGRVQDEIRPRPEAGLPSSAPLAQPGPHPLEPDTCTVLPIVFRFVPADSALARRTLAAVEALWNQAWEGGGYGRYHVASEPDSPGPWPFASLFVARAAVEAGLGDVARRTLAWLETVAGAPAGSWFEFYGPRQSPPFPQVGIIPWTWAEVIFLLVSHVLGVRPDERGIRVRPRLLPEMTRVEASIPIRDGRLALRVAVEPGRHEPLARTLTPDGWTIEEAASETVAPCGDGETTVEILLPGTSEGLGP